MLKKIAFCALLILSTIIPTISFCATQSKNAQDNINLQQIQGAFAFPIDNAKIRTRISINPKILLKQTPLLADVMDKITVIACTAGTCEFAKPNSGLGFYEADFQVGSAMIKAKQFNLLVVACSALGCAKNQLITKIIDPHDKWP